MLLEYSLDLEFASADSGGLVPVYLSQHQVAFRQAHLRLALTLSPTPAAIELNETGPLTNALALGNGLDFSELADDLEIHAAMLSDHLAAVNAL